MATHDVAFFRPYPFKVGQKIRIESGKRAGDWEVAAVDDRKVTLRCPISDRTFEWNRFCYFTEKKSGETWPAAD